MKNTILALVASSVILGAGPADAGARTYAFHRTLELNTTTTLGPIRIGREDYLRVFLECEVWPDGAITARVLATGTEQAELSQGEVHAAEFLKEASGVSVTADLNIGPAYWFTAKADTVWLASPQYSARLDAVAMIEDPQGRSGSACLHPERHRRGGPGAVSFGQRRQKDGTTEADQAG